MPSESPHQFRGTSFRDGRRRDKYDEMPPHFVNVPPEHRSSKLPGVQYDPKKLQPHQGLGKYPRYNNYGGYGDDYARHYPYPPHYPMSPGRTPDNGNSSYGGMYSQSDSKYRWRKVRGNLDLFVMERNERHLTSLHWKFQKSSGARKRTPGYDVNRGGPYVRPDRYWDHREPRNDLREYPNYHYVPEYEQQSGYGRPSRNIHDNMPMHDKTFVAQDRTYQPPSEPPPWETKNYSYGSPDYGIKEMCSPNEVPLHNVSNSFEKPLEKPSVQYPPRHTIRAEYIGEEGPRTAGSGGDSLMYYEEQMKLAEDRKKNEDTITALHEEQKEMERELSGLQEKLAELHRQNNSAEDGPTIDDKIEHIQEQIADLNGKLSENDQKLKNNEAQRQYIQTRQVLTETSSSKYGSEDIPQSPLFIIGDPKNGTAAAVAPGRYIPMEAITDGHVAMSSDSVFYEPPMYEEIESPGFIIPQREIELAEEQARKEMELKDELEKQMENLKQQLEEQLQNSAEHMKEENGKIIEEKVSYLEKQIADMDRKIKDSDSVIRKAVEDKKNREDALQKEREEWHARIERDRKAREESAQKTRIAANDVSSEQNDDSKNSTSSGRKGIRSPLSQKSAQSNFTNGLTRRVESGFPPELTEEGIRESSASPRRRKSNDTKSGSNHSKLDNGIALSLSSKSSKKGEFSPTSSHRLLSRMTDSRRSGKALDLISTKSNRRSLNSGQISSERRSPKENKTGESFGIEKFSPSRSQKVFPVDQESSRSSSIADGSNKSRWSSFKAKSPWSKSSQKQMELDDENVDEIRMTPMRSQKDDDFNEADIEDVSKLDGFSAFSSTKKLSARQKDKEEKHGEDLSRESSMTSLHSKVSDVMSRDFANIESKDADGSQGNLSSRNKGEGWGENRSSSKKSLLIGLGTNYCVVPHFIWKYLGDETDDEPITRKKCVAFILGVILIILLIAIILGLIIGLVTNESEPETSPIRFVVIPGNPEEALDDTGDG